MTDIIERLRGDYFRMMILGSPGSGKTYLTVNNILPAIKKKYDEYCIFTRPYNERFYLTQFKKRMGSHIPHIFTDVPNLMEIIENIKDLQKKNIKTYDKTGHPVFKSNILFLFDDVIQEKLFKDDRFLEIFINLRHLQISTILISQVTTKQISTAMKANTNFFCCFRQNGFYQRRFALDLIGETLSKENPTWGQAKIKKKALELYQDRVLKKQYGYIVIDEFANLF